MGRDMGSKNQIHRDFRFCPAVHMGFSRFQVSLMNGALRLANRFLFTPPPDVNVQDHTFPGNTRTVAVKVFRPANDPGSRERACLVYFHGGAFALTYGPGHLHSAAAYALRLDAVVVFVDYTLTNEGTFPEGFNDCYDATLWSASHAEVLGISREKIFVGGDSAGGNLAATVAQKVHDARSFPLLGQLLIYPVADRLCATESAKRFLDTPIWTGVSNERMWRKYLEKYPDGEAPKYAAAADRVDLGGLPPAYVELAEFDPLHDEGLHYAKRLAEQGVAVDVFDTRGTIHGYDTIAPRNPVSVEAMNRRIAFIERCLERPPA